MGKVGGNRVMEAIRCDCEVRVSPSEIVGQPVRVRTASPAGLDRKAVVARNAYKGGIWRLLRELSRALREQSRRLVE